MYMDIGMDTGDMILTEKVEIGEDETTGELIYQTYTVTAVMNNNVLSIDCGNAAAEIGIPNLSITYENIDD